MIRYDLKCEAGHGFEAWFRDSAAYDAQRGAGAVACPQCGTAEVDKALMTPRIGGGGRERAASPHLSAPPENEAAAALAELRRKLEAEADYVGRSFPETARRIHLGDEPARPVWGEATREQARELIEEGVPVAPLPPLPRRDD